MRISPRAGTILTIMVSDHRVITSGQEVTAFLTCVREVKALTSSYLHNERKEGVIDLKIRYLKNEYF